MSSSSPAMFERRRRILSEARRLLRLNDGADFSVRELCSRAGVAPNTFYNAFGSKEKVIALSVTRYFEAFFERTRFTHAIDSLEGVVERNIAASLRNIAIPAYVQAVTRLYFSSNESLSVRPEMDRIVGRFFMPWLERLRMHHQLAKGVKLQFVPGNLAAILFTHVLEWRNGRLSDEEFKDARVDAALCYLRGLARGQAERSLRAAIADFHGARLWFAEIEALARKAIGQAG